MSYRFRVDEGKLVLQVYVPPKASHYSYDREGTWRDANVEDIPTADPFRREPVYAEPRILCRDGEGAVFP